MTDTVEASFDLAMERECRAACVEMAMDPMFCDRFGNRLTADAVLELAAAIEKFIRWGLVD